MNSTVRYTRYTLHKIHILYINSTVRFTRYTVHEINILYVTLQGILYIENKQLLHKLKKFTFYKG